MAMEPENNQNRPELPEEELLRRERRALGEIALMESHSCGQTDEIQLKLRRLYLLAVVLILILAGVYFMLSAFSKTKPVRKSVPSAGQQR